ncbi:MAG: nucleotidyltransferase family protein [Rhodococcus sp. (in: high G+C Gram-positive bacteria)]
MTTVGLLLAAGAGTRYGEPKILVRGWLDLAVTALRGGGCSEVLVVVGAVHPPMPTGALAVVNENWQSGMAGSLQVGLLECENTLATHAAVHLVDTPDIGGDVVRRVLDAAEPTGLARATFGGRPGHPVVLARRWWADAGSGTGDEGARAFLRGNPEVLGVECHDLATGVDHDYCGPEQGTRTHATEFRRG